MDFYLYEVYVCILSVFVLSSLMLYFYLMEVFLFEGLNYYCKNINI